MTKTIPGEPHSQEPEAHPAHTHPAHTRPAHTRPAHTRPAHTRPSGSHPDHGETAADAATFWEERYSGRGQVWTGKVNAALGRETAGLEPGSALDLGSGEGGDAIWLAHRGWTVTAVDIAPSALALGARNAQAAGVAHRIRWVEADLATWQPRGRFDLVSAHFLHSPVELPREEILRRAASVVAPGGLLLVVGHAEFPPWSTHPPGGVVLPTPDVVLAALELPAGQWTVVTSALSDRAAIGPDGATATLVDSVLSVRRILAGPGVPTATGADEGPRDGR